MNFAAVLNQEEIYRLIIAKVALGIQPSINNDKESIKQSARKKDREQERNERERKHKDRCRKLYRKLKPALWF